MIVVDASVAVKWIVPGEARTDEAFSLLNATLARREAIIAPPLLMYEAANIVRQKVRRGEIGPERALALVDGFLALPIERSTFPEFHRRAVAIAIEFDLPAAYDAHYLALAEAASCPLWTDDLRLVRQARDRFPALRWLGDYRP